MNTPRFFFRPIVGIMFVATLLLGLRVDLSITQRNIFMHIVCMLVLAHVFFCIYISKQIALRSNDGKEVRALLAIGMIIVTAIAVVVMWSVMTVSTHVVEIELFGENNIHWPDLLTGVAITIPVVLIWALGWAAVSAIVQKRGHFISLLLALSLGMLSIVIPATLLPFPTTNEWLAAEVFFRWMSDVPLMSPPVAYEWEIDTPWFWWFYACQALGATFAMAVAADGMAEDHE